jgi:adenosylhomocysteine nucleosidase
MIVVLVALEVERREVRKKLKNLRTEPHPAGTRFDRGRYEGTEVALALVGRGSAAAAAIAERAIGHYRPAAVIFTGVAGGLRNWLRLGDVVVATKVYAPPAGRSEDAGFRAYPQSWNLAHEVEQVARHLALDRQWGTRIHFEPIAVGEVVLNGREAPEARRLHEHFADAIAVEMESAGAALAAHVNRSVPVAAVRGISDHADGSKDHSDGEGWQEAAAANAAAFALELAHSLDAPADRVPDEQQKAGNTVTNSGANSPIVATGGTITGDVSFDYGRGESR